MAINLKKKEYTEQIECVADYRTSNDPGVAVDKQFITAIINRLAIGQGLKERLISIIHTEQPTSALFSSLRDEMAIAEFVIKAVDEAKFSVKPNNEL